MTGWKVYIQRHFAIFGVMIPYCLAVMPCSLLRPPPPPIFWQNYCIGLFYLHCTPPPPPRGPLELRYCSSCTCTCVAKSCIRVSSVVSRSQKVGQYDTINFRFMKCDPGDCIKIQGNPIFIKGLPGIYVNCILYLSFFLSSFPLPPPPHTHTLPPSFLCSPPPPPPPPPPPTHTHPHTAV